MRNYLKILCFTAFLGGCSGYGGEWPSLSDPLPDESERERIFATADVKVGPESYAESETMNLASHETKQNSIAKEIANAIQEFNETFKSITEETDPEDRLIAWTGSQLALSRASATINRLRDLLNTSIEPASAESENYLKGLERAIGVYDHDLAKAKAALEAAKPEG